MRHQTNTKARAFLAFARDDGASDAAIGAELGVSRQRISVLRQQFRKGIATSAEDAIRAADGPATVTGRSGLHEKSSVAGSASAALPASNSNSPAHVLVLRELANEDEQLAVLVDKILRGDAPRAAAIAVGINGRVFSRRMQSDDRFRSLVLRAAHEAESSVAQNLYRLATGSSPQAAQSAIAWLNARVPDDWSPNRQRIDIEVSAGIDIRALLATGSFQTISEISEMEGRLQNPELPAPENLVVTEPIPQPKHYPTGHKAQTGGDEDD